MPHHMPLISTIVGGLVLAFVLGAIAHRDDIVEDVLDEAAPE
jgi:predicted Kef-type K+ transport protein